MSEFPSALRYKQVVAGMRNPDYEPLLKALPPPTPIDKDPEILPLRELGDTFLAIGEAMPKAGKEGTFWWVYGTLTHVLAAVTERRPEVSYLPYIECEDDLVRQANFFARLATGPAADHVRQALAFRACDWGLQRQHASAIPRPWARKFENPAFQLGQPVGQLFSGLIPHVMYDLPPSLLASGVSSKYMRRGGDYDNVTRHIGYTTKQLAPLMMEGGNPIMVRSASELVWRAIGVMRGHAKNSYFRLQRAEDTDEYDRIIARNEQVTKSLMSMSGSIGAVALSGFAKIAGAEPWPQRPDEQPPMLKAA